MKTGKEDKKARSQDPMRNLEMGCGSKSQGGIRNRAGHTYPLSLLRYFVKQKQLATDNPSQSEPAPTELPARQGRVQCHITALSPAVSTS